MDETEPRRRGRRPWAVAAILLLAVAYPASVGPATYALNRGWFSPPVYRAVYAPVREAVAWSDPRGIGPVHAYARWWATLGARHARGAGSD